MLIDQAEYTNLPAEFSWGHSAISHVLSKFKNNPGTRDGFPCIFGHTSVRRGNLRFLLVPYDIYECRYDYRSFVDDLRSYVDQVDVNSLDLSSHRPLLVLFEPAATLTTTDQFEQIFMEAMQFLIDVDQEAWPTHVSKNPEHHTWTMCFRGCELFVNVSHPAHVLRRSRNLGESLAFVINPRKIFDIAAPDDAKGRHVTETIRHNIDLYDDVPHTPLLGSYLLGEAQWPQYMIPDNNDLPPLKCSLRFKKLGSLSDT